MDSETSASFFADRFGRSHEVIARAPGRIEFIGNHLDYNGGLVLGAAIDRHVTVALGRREDGQIRLFSAGKQEVYSTTLEAVRREEGDAAWVNYVLGVLVMLQRDGLQAEGGFDLAVDATLPSGAGLSSSAALELAAAYAFTAAYGSTYEPKALARLCRRAENEWVGVPCGILDQAVSALGRAGHLVLVDPVDEAHTTVPIPGGTSFWIFNTHHQHSLVASLYARRHAECMEALERLRAVRPSLRSLAEADSAFVEAHQPALTDVLYRRALHVAGEHERVHRACDALRESRVAAVGALLLSSHASSSRLFENSTEALDFLVEGLSDLPDVYGARLTGGGFGGAVLAFTKDHFALEQAQPLLERYARQFGAHPSAVPCRTSDGAGLVA
jgi:galactokinase